MDEENTLRSVCEVKQKYALNSALGQLYTLVKPEDIGKEGGSSAQRSVRQVYNYMTCNGGSNDMQWWVQCYNNFVPFVTCFLIFSSCRPYLRHALHGH